MNIWKHFKTITHHKILVAKGCFKVGLYKQGLLHDMSKYSPTEFWVGAKYYQGTRSPNNAEREDIGYSSAWLHHKGRNKHHYEYWIDYSMQALPGGMAPVPMPDKYIAEMIGTHSSGDEGKTAICAGNAGRGGRGEDLPVYQRGTGAAETVYGLAPVGESGIE